MEKEYFFYKFDYSLIFLLFFNFAMFYASESDNLEKSKPKRKKEKSLLAASRQGAYCNVESLLKEEVDVNATWENGWTPLMEAADSGHENVLRLLIQNNACIDIDAGEYHRKYTALMYTVFTGDPHRKNGKPGEETKELAYILLDRGADYTLSGTNGSCYLSLLKELKIKEKEKRSMIKKSSQIVQNRCNTICKVLDENGMPWDIINYFFEYLYDATNDCFDIEKRVG